MNFTFALASLWLAPVLSLDILAEARAGQDWLPPAWSFQKMGQKMGTGSESDEVPVPIFLRDDSQDDRPVPVSLPVSIDGPSAVAAGKSAIVKVDRESIGSDADWRVEPPGVNWITGENRNESFVILLDLEPGRYFISLAGYEKKLHATHLVEVASPSPVPPVPVPVPPTPTPPLPDGRFRLAPLAAEWSAAIPEPHRAQARPLAGSFRAIAAALGAGTLTDPAEILAETRASNNAALGDSTHAWKPWGEKLQQTLERLHDEGVLKHPADYQQAWLEIAQGLEAIPIRMEVTK